MLDPVSAEKVTFKEMREGATRTFRGEWSRQKE